MVKPRSSILRASPPAGHSKQCRFKVPGVTSLFSIQSCQSDIRLVDNSILNHSDDYHTNQLSLIIEDFSKPTKQRRYCDVTVRVIPLTDSPRTVKRRHTAATLVFKVNQSPRDSRWLERRSCHVICRRFLLPTTAG